MSVRGLLLGMAIVTLIVVSQITPAAGGDMANMERQTFALFYFMKGEPALIRNVAPLHAQYWEDLQPQGFMGGPFKDYSGGLIVFQASSEEQAEKMVSGDPFVENDLLETHWVKAWAVHAQKVPGRN